MKKNKLLLDAVIIIVVILTAYFILNKPSDDVNTSSSDNFQSSVELQSQDLSQSSSNDKQSSNNGQKPFSISSKVSEEYGDKISIPDIKLEVGSDGLCYIEGTISNNTDSDLNIILINFSIYDVNDKLIQDAFYGVENFNAGKTNSFKISIGNGVSIDDIAKYELSAVEGVF